MDVKTFTKIDALARGKVCNLSDLCSSRMQYSKVTTFLLAAVAIMISIFTANINYFMHCMDYVYRNLFN